MGSGKVFIAGCGYVGTHLAQHLVSENYELTVMVRSVESCQSLEPYYHCIKTDLDHSPLTLDVSFADTTLFYFVPPPSQGLIDSRIERFLQAIQKNNTPDKIILISTTGVYGDCADEWVDETRPPHADTDRASRRLSAEQSLQQWCDQRGVDYAILRVPGIYGPGKLPLKRLQEQKPVLSIEESPWSNRVHIDDLVQSCISAMTYAGKDRVFNISDGNPSSMSDFFLSVAATMNLPTPQQISLDECKKVFSDNMISYLLESKKIDNSRMRHELNVQLKYPLLSQGLEAIKRSTAQAD